MGYLLLSAALISGALKGFCGKKTSCALETASDSMTVNVLRMLLCIVIGFVLTVLQDGVGTLRPDGFLLLVTALSGISSGLFVISWLLSVKGGAYMMVEVFLLLGVAVPIVFCRILFGEEIGGLRIVGILLLLLAVYIMCTYNASVKGKLSKRALALLFLCGLANGFSDFAQKLFVKMRPDGSVAAFNFFTYAFTAVFLIAVCIFYRRRERERGAPPRSAPAIVKPIFLYILVMAIALFAHSYFKTQAAQYLDAVKLYPLSQGGSVVLSLLMSALLFKEKINFKCIMGICLSFGALLIINLL